MWILLVLMVVLTFAATAFFYNGFKELSKQGLKNALEAILNGSAAE